VILFNVIGPTPSFTLSLQVGDACGARAEQDTSEGCSAGRH